MHNHLNFIYICIYKERKSFTQMKSYVLCAAILALILMEICGIIYPKFRKPILNNALKIAFVSKSPMAQKLFEKKIVELSKQKASNSSVRQNMKYWFGLSEPMFTPNQAIIWPNTGLILMTHKEVYYSETPIKPQKFSHMKMIEAM